MAEEGGEKPPGTAGLPSLSLLGCSQANSGPIRSHHPLAQAADGALGRETELELEPWGRRERCGMRMGSGSQGSRVRRLQPEEGENEESGTLGKGGLL